MITAPYNFVPLNKEVFYPNWADEVSLDAPFEDGESGEIDITITAKSPIFIRDGKDDEQFCQYNGQYYIPGSSVKGMIRNVLEIMSFSKMGEDSFNDDTYAVRDLRNRDLYMSKMTPDNTFCGWLKKSTDGYIIEDCGKPGRIRHEEIDKIFNIAFASKFKEGNFGNKAKDKTAEKKYNLINAKSYEYNFQYLKKDVNREIYQYDQNGSKKGTLVLTGQPSARNEPVEKKPSGKIFEFIFFESKREIEVPEKVFENFKFAYFDKRDTEPKESPDWTYWKKRLEEGEKVPVFFQKNGNTIAHFGLSFLYKLPYKHSIKDGIPKTHFDERKDLAQTIFGYIDQKTKTALKGRVQFSHFKAIKNAEILEERREILGTPRASYYPMYIKQEDGRLYKTYMDESFSIAGRKRYPIHNSSTTKKTEDTGNENVGTTFSPLKDGVVFKGKLRYHNLKKAELGALLSALTFHNTKDTYHNIGLAKSLGYGKIALKIENIDNINEYLKTFESEITIQVSDWATSPQLKELLSMATEQNNTGNSRLDYMSLADFAKNKTGENKDYLRNYTRLEGITTIQPLSLISEDDLANIREKQKEQEQAEEARLEAKKQEQRKQKEQEQADKLYTDAINSDNLQILQNFIDKYPNHDRVAEITEKKATLEQQQQQNRHQKVNEQAQYAFDALQKNRGNPKKYNKDKEKFIKKWSAGKNNKGSEYILELIETLKQEK